MIDRVHGGDINRYLENIPDKRSKITDFSANINPLGLSPKVKTAIIKNITGVIHYPEPDSRGLKKALGYFHGIKQDNLAIGNGSIELIYLIPRALRPKRILILTPTFSEYEFSSRANGAKITFLNTEEGDNFRVEVSRLRKFLSRVDLVFLGNPNNPTGSCIHAEELSSVVRLCTRYKTILVVDEVFIDFVDTCNEDSFLQRAPRNKFLLVLRSLTKFFALPGLRIGYVVGHRDLVNKITNLQYPWNINSLAQAVGREVFKNRNYINYSRQYIAKEREFLFDGLKGIKRLKVFEPSSNFILCKLDGSSIKSAKILNRKLIKKGLVVRNCGNFRGLSENFFRVAVRKRSQNHQLLTTLKEVL